MECSQCPYGGYPRMPAPVPRPASFAIVGEAPGTQELIRKEAFVGMSGQLLRRTLAKVGIPVEDAYITNSMLCRPPVGKPISVVAVRNCQQRVLEELRQVNPRVVLVVGNTALRSITNNFKLKITDEQGRRIESSLLTGVCIVAALHPAKVLRDSGDYRAFYIAIEYAAQMLQGGSPKDPGVTKYKVVTTLDEAEEAVAFLQQFTLVAGDIEATSLNPYRGRVLVLGVAWSKNRVMVFPREVLSALKPLFLVPHMKWAWHNGKFDTAFLRRIGLAAEVSHDTLLLSYCINENPPHNLEYLASTLLGASPYKADIQKLAPSKAKMGYAEVPKEELYGYVAKDADYTYQLMEKLLPQVEGDASLKKLYYELLIPATHLLRFVERKGIYVSTQALEVLREKFEQESEALLNEIEIATEGVWSAKDYKLQTGAKSAGAKFKPTSSKQLAWLLYDRLRLRPAKMRGRSTVEGVIEELRGRVPVVDLTLKLRSAKKSLATYVKGIQKRLDLNSRVHTSYLLHGTSTGRLSSRGPNVQNIPQDPTIRGIFQAPPGRLLIEADYKGAELRMLGHLSGDEFFTRVFVEGRDLHDEVATFLFGKDFEEKDRMKAKTLNFGIPYGREAYSIAMAFDVSMQEAQGLIDGWFQRAPQAAAFLQECAASVRQGRVLTTPFGRKRRFGLVTPVNLEDLQREARNFPIQSMTSDIALASSIRLRELLIPFDASIINLVHDSILIELPSDPEVALQVAHIARKCMMEVPHEKLASVIVFEVDIKVGQRWGSLQKLGSAKVAAGEESGELEEIRRIVEKCEEVHYEEGLV